MYHLIGSDGREYGPADAETIHSWIAQGRANAATRIRQENTTKWKSLSETPEFAAALGAAAPPRQPGDPPPAPPRTDQVLGALAAEAISSEAISNDYRFDISRCFSRAWEIVQANFWLTVGAGALALVLVSAASAIPFASLLVGYVVLGGLNWLYLKMIRGARAEINDLFVGFGTAFVPLMLFSIVSQLLAGVGVLLCVLPGIYLVVAWLPFTALIILDKKVEFWPAMELSRKVISNHWWQMFGFLLLCLLFNLAGTLLLCVGLFVTFPLTTIATVVAYEEIFSRVKSPTSPAPALPPGI